MNHFTEAKTCTVQGCDGSAKTKGLCLKHYMRLRRTGSTDSEKPERLTAHSLQGCKIEGCGKSAVAFDLCCTHYSKFKKYGDPLAGRTNSGGTCSVDGCDKPVKGLTFCQTHYDRFKKHGDPLLVKIMPKDADPTTTVRIVKSCGVAGCKEKYRANGYCSFHSGRARHHGGDPLGGGGRRLPNNSQGGKCKVDGCEKPSQSLHFCPNHFRKFKMYGDPLGGGTQDGRSKEWRTNKQGYVEKWSPDSPYAAKNGFIFQHRQVMGEHIGRPLLPIENVHHKNGNRADNRIENLELWSKVQPAGQRVEDKVAWAREIIDLYGNLDIV